MQVNLSSFDVRNRGQFKSQVFITHISKCVNQAVLEYLFELNFLNPGGPSATGQCSNANKESLKGIIDPSQSLLSSLHRLGAPSVSCISQPLALPSWALRGFITEIYDMLGDLVPISQNSVFFGRHQESSDDISYESYFINKSEKGGFGNSHVPDRRSTGQGLGALGKATGYLPQLFGFFKERWKFALLSLVRNDTDSFDALFASPSSTTAPRATTSASLPEFSFYGPLSVDSCETLFIPRYPFSIMSLDSENVKFWTYNWAPALVTQLSKQLQKLGDWTKLRQGLLSGILHQKMGLFYHSDTTNPSFSLGSIDNLINNFSPPRVLVSPEKEKSDRKGREKRGMKDTILMTQKIGPIGPGFESILKYTYPLEPMGTKGCWNTS